MRQFEGRGADILAECLIDAGIDLIFGVPATPAWSSTTRSTSGPIRSAMSSPGTSATPASWRMATRAGPTGSGFCEVSSGGGGISWSAAWARPCGLGPDSCHHLRYSPPQPRDRRYHRDRPGEALLGGHETGHDDRRPRRFRTSSGCCSRLRRPADRRPWSRSSLRMSSTSMPWSRSPR